MIAIIDRRRTTAGAITVAAGLVHLGLVPHHVAEAPALGAAFVLAAVALISSGMALLLGDDRGWSVAGLVSAGVAAAYVASRTGVAFGHHHGWDPLGVVTTAGELAVAVVAVTRTGATLRPRAVSFGVALGMVGAVLSPQLATAEPTTGGAPDGCVQTDRTIRLWAHDLTAPGGPIRVGWGTTEERSSASVPGPLIEMMEGECVAITVTNDVPAETLAELREQNGGSPGHELGISLHVHGVKYTTSSDGTVHTGSWIPPGETRTYVWYAAPRVVSAGRVTSMGTAGYWWYHDHVAGTSHGTGGLEAGLFGGVVVRRPSDVVRPDRSFTAVFGGSQEADGAHGLTIHCGDTTIGLDGNVRTSEGGCLTARQGERVEIVAVGIGDLFHTFHLHGHNWAANRTGLLTGVDDETALIDARTLGPSESFGFQVVAGEAVGPGQWMLHCHVQEHSDAGMVSFLDVVPPDGSAVATTVAPHDHGEA